MKRLVFALFCIAALVPASQAESQTEGRPCAPEPTDELIAYGDLITCAIDVLGDSDLFRFNGTLGEVVTIRVTDQAGGGSIPSCVLELFRPDDLTLVTTVSNFVMCEIRTTLDRSGQFTIRITEAGNDHLMTYALEVDRLWPPSTSAPLVTYGDTLTSQRIDPQGDADLFLFNGTVGEVVTIRVTDQAGGGSIPSCVLELFRPGDAMLVATVSSFVMCEIRTTLDRTGLFTFRVTEGGNDHLMTYLVELDRLSPPSTTAQRINPGDTFINQRIEPQGDADLYLFQGAAGDIISLRVTDLAGGGSIPSPVVELFAPDGSLIQTASHFAIAVIEMTLTESGIFTARVSEGGNDHLMTYNIEYLCLSGTCPRISPPPPILNDLYDDDGTSDIAVWRPSNGIWYVIRSSDGTVRTRPWGADGDIPVPGDYDGDGKPDIAVWRPSTGVWYIVRSSDGVVITHHWGAGFAPFNDIAVPADYDGDGKTDIAIWRASTGVWYIIRSSDGGLMVRAWGAGFSPYNDVPVPADYDGDGQADVAVWRTSTGVWYILRSSDGVGVGRHWGTIGDVPVPGDYDGDGKRDIAVWRPSSGVWFIIQSSDDDMIARQWGAGFAPYNDVPVQADYDGDGKTDIAVWRSSTGIWYVIRSSDDNFFSVPWGAPNDVTVPR